MKNKIKKILSLERTHLNIAYCLLAVSLCLTQNTLAQNYYTEQFNTQLNGATSDSDDTPWTTIQGSAGSLAVDATYEDLTAFSVTTEAVWNSGSIPILGNTSLSVDAFEYSTPQSSDYIRIYYKLDGGSEVLFGNFSGDFGSGTASTTVSGSSVEIVVRFLNNDGEFHSIDNVTVLAAGNTALYSVASGDWNSRSTWSGIGYGGASCNCYPNETAEVNIGNGITVNLNVDADANDVTIANTGTLRYTGAYVELEMNNDGVFTINSGGTLDENGQIEADLDFESGSGTSQLIVNSGSSFNIGRLFMYGANSLDINGDGDINAGSLNLRSAGSVVNNLTGTFSSDSITINSDNASLTNNGTMFLTNDFELACYGGEYNNILFTNSSGARIDVGGDINPNNGDFTINNSGIINQYGNFINIDTGSDFNNLGGSTWAWYYVGAYDTDINTILSAGGLFEYEGFGNQLIIPIPYSNLTIDGSGSKALQANTNVSGVLYMNAGYVSLGDFNLTLGNSASIVNSSSSSFVLTDGNGTLIQNNIGTGGKTGSILFPVGLNTTSYTPVTINNTGTADNFNVRVCSGIYEEGGCSTGTMASSLVVDRTWFINEAVAGGSNAALTFQWNLANELSGFDRSDLNVIHFNGTDWGALASTSASGSGPYTASASGVSSFSPFGIEGGDSPLPVELTSFNAALTNDKVKLTWETASELNNDYFTIERTSDLEYFKEIAVVAGKGTCSSRSRYLSFDHSPSSGVLYYRLKQTDFDGSINYSQLVQVNNTSEGNQVLSLYPVPSSGYSINLNISDASSMERIPIIISDIQGRIVHQEELSGNNQEVKLEFTNKLSRGVYLLKVNTPAPVSKYFVVE